MQDKARLGTRFVCFNCGCKFYDLNRDEALCPDCGTDQAGAPARDIRALLANKGFLPSGFAADPDAEEKKAAKEAEAAESDPDADADSDGDGDEDEELLTYQDAEEEEEEASE